MKFPTNFEETLAGIISLADAVGCEWMHIGGVAVNVWGYPRATGDVDVALAVSMDLSKKVTQLMERNGWQLAGGPGQIKSTGIYLAQYAKEIGKKEPIGVDLFFAMNDWQRAAIERKRPIKFGGQAHFIASAEDLILYKLIANRTKDHGDVDNILDYRFENLDMPYLSSWARTLSVNDRLKEAVSRFHDRKDMGM